MRQCALNPVPEDVVRCTSATGADDTSSNPAVKVERMRIQAAATMSQAERARRGTGRHRAARPAEARSGCIRGQGHERGTGRDARKVIGHWNAQGDPVHRGGSLSRHFVFGHRSRRLVLDTRCTRASLCCGVSRARWFAHILAEAVAAHVSWRISDGPLSGWPEPGLSGRPLQKEAECRKRWSLFC